MTLPVRTPDIRVGTAGWSIPRAMAGHFESAGTHLQRYSQRFSCVEINSSFYRAHAAGTYARWRDTTPANFRFAVKVPRVITHELQLRGARKALVGFLAQTAGLAEKRGPLLIQLPPSLAFDRPAVVRFFDTVRDLYAGMVVCEPRHPTWFSRRVDLLLERYRIARVAADPACVPAAAVPAGWSGLTYFRLHGSPHTYWSRYDDEYLSALTASMRNLASMSEIWCVFDNTASGAALENAWSVTHACAAHLRLKPGRRSELRRAAFHTSPQPLQRQ